MVRAERPSPRTLDVPLAERAYLTRAWPLLSELRFAMRTEPALRLAVLFGSQARGDARPSSDIDLVARVKDSVRMREVHRRLEEKLGKSIHLVDLDDVRHAPLLFAEALRDGRVLVDRYLEWPGLKRELPAAEEAASVHRQKIDAAFTAAFRLDDSA